MLNDVQPLSGYREPYGLLCAILQDGSREWRWELDPALPADAMVWRPGPGMHSIGALILHMISAEVFWFEGFALGQPMRAEERELLLVETTDVDTWRWPEPPREPLAWYFALHDGIRARTLESVKAWPAPESERILDGMPRTMRWVLGHVIQHESYHGGQAVLLSRLWRMATAGEQA